MKKIIILFIITIVYCQSSIVSAQTLSPKVIPTCGGYQTAGGNSLSFTMGETFYTTLQNGNVLLTQGEQQPYILLKLLNLHAFIEGFYMGGGQMQAVLYNNDPMLPSNYCDSITVDLHDANAPYDLVVSKLAILLTDGSAEVRFPSTLANVPYYVAIRGRNIIETWSKLPVTLGNNTTFDFTQ